MGVQPPAPPADSAELHTGASRFTAAAESLSQLRQQLTSRSLDLVQGADSWAGDARQAFQAAWERFGQDTDAAADALNQTAQVLTKFADALDDVKTSQAWQLLEGIGLGLVTVALGVVDVLQAGADVGTDAATVVTAADAAEAVESATEGFLAADGQAAAELEAVPVPEVGAISGSPSSVLPVTTNEYLANPEAVTGTASNTSDIANAASANAGTAEATSETRSVADEVAGRLNGKLEQIPSDVDSWKVTVENGKRPIIVRIMEAGSGGRPNPYFRVSVDGRGAYTLEGELSTDRLATHIDLTPQSIDQVENIVEQIAEE